MSLDLNLRAVDSLELRDPFTRVDGRVDSYRRWLENYKALISEALSRQDFQAISRILLRLPTWVSDERNLWAAWQHLAQYGSTTPGPDGCTWSDYTLAETWEQVREIRDVLRRGDYRRGPERQVRIPKAAGNGFRTVTISNIQDRVVARALQQILQPRLENTPTLNDCSRSSRGPLYALARAEILTRRAGRYAWGAQDLRNAYDRVPRQRLLDVVRSHVPSEPVIELVRTLIDGPGRRGIPQGSPVSSLLFEAYRNHFVDHPWRQRHPRVPLLSYADDLLVIGHPSEPFRGLHADLDQLATAAGFASKYDCDEMFHDIRQAPVTWLGYRCLWKANRLQLRPVRLSYEDEQERVQGVSELTERFVRLHRHGDAYARVRPLVQGLVNYAGAGYRDVDRRAAYDMIGSAARQAEFTDLPSFEWFEHRWRSSFEGWRTIRARAARQTPPGAQAYYAPSNVPADAASAPF